MKIPSLSPSARFAGAVTLLSLLAAGPASAAPYASGVQIAGTNVSFILNQPADQLSVSINGGAPVFLDGTTAGSKLFSLGSPTDTFTIRVTDNDATGYRIPTGGTVAAATNGLSQPTAQAGFNLVSSDTNVLGRFNSPRGVTVSNNPNAPNFGTAYVSNSSVGTLAVNGSLPARTLGDGLYAVRADFTDAYGQGNTARTGTLPFDASASSPFRITAASNGDIYVADFSDAAGMVGRVNPSMTAGGLVLANTGGATALPAGRNHGSTTSVVPVFNGSSLTLYTVDEDLTTSYLTGAGSTTDRNSMWRYDIGTGSTPYNGLPTRMTGVSLVPLASSDMDFGSVDGKLYAAQNRSAGGEDGVQVASPDGSATLYNSLIASRTLLGNPTAPDILRNIQGMAVSPDQTWMALMLNNSDVAVIPLVNGIPDLANRMVVDTGTDVNSGRDIAFDAAGNIHYVSSGQGLYRVLSPGGATDFVTAWDGSQFSFATVPEPASTGLLLFLSGTLLLRRRRNC